ncbi:ARM repeat-containing protein [Fomitiporia mediterranea MF3/22]|uniref:ARM repeat-containing protein n=1 Tax=Fomitiporia mediterranea (strain MF3/22) TaxID=694068 RepID=UPI0004407D24|nr:ARM repeat-containing protein [Fomitiporia mediterranea MF3/22]EJD04150.1 ARM repeat-containing protein [Fomitiporia mediterranea MF3/22]
MSTTAEWVTPLTRPELIENLVSGVDRYNPSNVSILEDYLYHQIRSNEYDCLANLAILKLYQFNPALYNPDVIINVLIKALTAVPFPDFNLCIALLGERPVTSNLDEPDPLPELLPTLTILHDLLLQCRFPAFWTLFKSEELASLRENYTVECAGFEDSIRKVAIKAVKAAFKKIGVDRLSTYLDLKGEDLVDYLSHLGWEINGSVVSIPPNPDNQVEATVVRENIQLSQLSKIIAHTAKST